MAQWEWVRTALAVEHAGSVTAGANVRHISQPAASQQIKALERALGVELFERHRSGVRATADGARFFAQISGPFEQIQWLLDGLDGGSVDMPDAPVVVGCPAAWFEKALLPGLDPSVPIRTRFGSDADTLADLKAGRVDIAITRTLPSPAETDTRPVADYHFVLVAAPSIAPTTKLTATDELADWVRRTPWVGFSEELPSTRRFWSEVTGAIQPTRVQLVAPDLRTVASAVEHAVGASLLPNYVCAEAVRSGQLVEVFDVAHMLPTESWSLSITTRQKRPETLAVADSILETTQAPRQLI